jgi:hypothetical protein
MPMYQPGRSMWGAASRYTGTRQARSSRASGAISSRASRTYLQAFHLRHASASPIFPFYPRPCGILRICGSSR